MRKQTAEAQKLLQNIARKTIDGKEKLSRLFVENQLRVNQYFRADTLCHV